ncbi:hypothetical protein GCM10010912_04410 [Paenibacillus albidus]|uniref:Uncharacterized protein n=1 Tax=Paenibacillus albidus TaxID=2041023 RepID=A0A917BXS4_9BACL|nr:hypothetical protein [Paenibacillus albidus]GGF62386.1 hypothetical protein GCM10010912_04410 [Paenibacillus albidus]
MKWLLGMARLLLVGSILELPEDAGRVVYTIQEQDNLRLVEKEIFDALLQPQKGSE